MKSEYIRAIAWVTVVGNSWAISVAAMLQLREQTIASAMDRLTALALVALLVTAAFLPLRVQAQDAPYIPITSFIPPLVTTDAAPDHTEKCGQLGLLCLRWVAHQLAGWEQYFGCDHRAVFPTVYKLLTRETIRFIKENPSYFDDPAGIGYEAVRFYELFHAMITSQLAGEPIPPAWQRAMEVANSGDWTAAHDMLLAINAHVQRDMPFAVAATGLNLPNGNSRKPDHDAFNRVLNAAYDTIVQAVGQRYDPIMLTVDDVGLLVDNIAAAQLVAVWREGVWRNAERLILSKDTLLWELTVRSIELAANVTARVLMVGQIPGHRAQRDAYCEAQTGLSAEPPTQPPRDRLLFGANNPIRANATVAGDGGSAGGCTLGRGRDAGLVLLLLLACVLRLARGRR